GSDSDGAGVDPVEAGASPGAEPAEPTGPAPQRRGPGRPPGGGTGTGSAKKSASLDLTGLAGVWSVMHVQLSRLADCPELAMSEQDAKVLMTAAQNVMRHYSIAASQKAIDWMTFASVASFMYAPRAV